MLYIKSVDTLRNTATVKNTKTDICTVLDLNRLAECLYVYKMNVYGVRFVGREEWESSTEPKGVWVRQYVEVEDNSIRYESIYITVFTTAEEDLPLYLEEMAKQHLKHFARCKMAGKECDTELLGYDKFSSVAYGVKFKRDKNKSEGNWLDVKASRVYRNTYNVQTTGCRKYKDMITLDYSIFSPYRAAPSKRESKTFLEKDLEVIKIPSFVTVIFMADLECISIKPVILDVPDDHDILFCDEQIINGFSCIFRVGKRNLDKFKKCPYLVIEK